MTSSTRQYSPWASESVRGHLADLLKAASTADVDKYREAMRSLGADLAIQIGPMIPAKGEILIVMTVEDADYLGQGLLDALNVNDRTKVFCYWNERDKTLDIAPIRSRYEEPLSDADVAAVIIIKSVISGACVVRTNLTEALTKIDHDVPIYVVAPVMHIDAPKRLAQEFPDNIARRFQFMMCATDLEKDGDTVKPGIGGSVYELLGLGNQYEKNRVRPKIVSERTRRWAAGASP